ncbi:hypothetical protein EVAR_34101_1 [Eumeta japonica]|uniref:Uncharacterized protein n=1 Tax=Eumeta variegata TaxID=151549 RepID=A0A4C1WMF5_EUMVA|nr:hypothetical protein EVAR_34101_1 [Eumeta japonica]
MTITDYKNYLLRPRMFVQLAHDAHSALPDDHTVMANAFGYVFVDLSVFLVVEHLDCNRHIVYFDESLVLRPRDARQVVIQYVKVSDDLEHGQGRDRGLKCNGTYRSRMKCRN